VGLADNEIFSHNARGSRHGLGGRADRPIFNGARGRAAPIYCRAALCQSQQRPERQYFADGITEDLTTDLSRISQLLVISRNSTFTYKNKPVNAKQIGREFGVRYVLEGSVRRSGNRSASAPSSSTPRPTRTCGRSASTPTQAIFSHCRTISRARLRLRSTQSWLLRRPPGLPSIPARWTTFFGGAPHQTRGPRPSIFLKPSSCSSMRWRSIPGRSRRRAYWL
jgi:hypothetical protein